MVGMGGGEPGMFAMVAFFRAVEGGCQEVGMGSRLLIGCF